MSETTSATAYYEDKVDSLRALFGADRVVFVPGGMKVDGRFFPVLDDVIVTLDSGRLPARLRKGPSGGAGSDSPWFEYAPDIQATFGDEWRTYPRVLPEHEAEFHQYFDLVDVSELGDLRLCDLGCGIGRWSYFLAQHCREIVLVDYSEAIFVARENLRHANNTIFVMADVLDLPFGDDVFDLVYCLGVLHHLPVDALDAFRGIRRLAPRHLVYLYYALDNRPAYFRWILGVVTRVRRSAAGIESPRARSLITLLVVLTVYAPLITLGRLLGSARAARFIPLAETYSGKSLTRLRQDAYDRFFTRIEQRFSREQILALADTFATVEISEELPYWHFLCQR